MQPFNFSRSKREKLNMRPKLWPWRTSNKQLAPRWLKRMRKVGQGDASTWKEHTAKWGAKMRPAEFEVPADYLKRGMGVLKWKMFKDINLKDFRKFQMTRWQLASQEWTQWKTEGSKFKQLLKSEQKEDPWHTSVNPLCLAFCSNINNCKGKINTALADFCS